MAISWFLKDRIVQQPAFIRNNTRRASFWIGRDNGVLRRPVGARLPAIAVFQAIDAAQALRIAGKMERGCRQAKQ
jgi:hypothetical protein